MEVSSMLTILSGVGFLLTYDTRDVPANAYRGT